ncbi:hypothetical protein Syun_011278 [Stephania yunnanensis]|uniref:Uncharacterized protein n=1 Tax=Stephania yunnanensis TaxID=152371 RepID=A0AAP0PE96_9MAGN
MRIIHRLESIGGELVASATPWKPEVHWEDRKWEGLLYPSELTIPCPNGTAKLLISRTPEAVHLKALRVVNPSDQHNMGVGRMDRPAELVVDAPTLRSGGTVEVTSAASGTGTCAGYDNGEHGPCEAIYAAGGADEATSADVGT